MSDQRTAMRTRSQQTKTHRAFTLVELLVVISIIGILAALLTVGITKALQYARQTAIKVAIHEIDMGIEETRQASSAYPPSLHSISGNSDQRTARESDLKRYLLSRFPKHQEPEELIDKLLDLPGASTSPGEANNKGVNAAEALVFWLSEFSKDPKYPISGSGGPSFPAGQNEDITGRKFVGGIDNSKLGPTAGNNFNGRFITYTVQGSQRRINLWTYTQSGKTQPFLYFDTSRHPPIDAGSVKGIDAPYYAPGQSEKYVVALKTLSANNTPVWANDKKFQILHSGIDDDWGNFTTVYSAANTSGVFYPTGPFLLEIADTQVNFSDKTLEDSQP